jgi:hypothetical protein
MKHRHENSASGIGRREDEQGPRAVPDGRPSPRPRSRSFGAMVAMGTAGHPGGGIAGGVVGRDADHETVRAVVAAA